MPIKQVILKNGMTNKCLNFWINPSGKQTAYNSNK